MKSNISQEKPSNWAGHQYQLDLDKPILGDIESIVFTDVETMLFRFEGLGGRETTAQDAEEAYEWLKQFSLVHPSGERVVVVSLTSKEAWDAAWIGVDAVRLLNEQANVSDRWNEDEMRGFIGYWTGVPEVIQGVIGEYINAGVQNLYVRY